ncbi:MAG TPA: hypothetical protein PKD90_17580, partial [Phnomibacter sp.]|nr:hypothetical protein [Phnomibacter sp.]
MKKGILSLAVIGSAFLAQAQLPEDALRYGFPLTGGTARNQAIGGVMASLGGDISAAHINPAGIGLYKNAEFVLSPNFNMLRNKYDYRGNNTASNENGIGYGTSGFVVGKMLGRGHSAKSSAFAITINQLANYRANLQYSGVNNNSSWTEQYLEQATRDLAGQSIPNIVNGLANNYIFGTSLAFDTYLIDTFMNNGQLGLESMVPIGQGAGIRQINNVRTTGGAHEVALSFGNNYADRLHLGMSIGIPFYQYNRTQTFREEDLSGNTNNDFNFFEFEENYSSRGVGINAKLGLIYRPADRVRLGLALHTPTFGGFTDNQRARITADTERKTNLPQPLTTTSDDLRGNSNAGNYEYNLTTPYRVIGSVAFVLNEVKDITKQKGFISADVEYVNYRGVRFGAADPTNT